MKTRIGEYTVEALGVISRNRTAQRYSCLKDGASKPYVIAYDPNKYLDSEFEGWGCSCKGWTMKRGTKMRTCKHLKMLAAQILGLEVA